MVRLEQALTLAVEIPDKCGKEFVISELRRNTRMSLSSARIVLLSALASHECILTELDKQNIDTLMRMIEELRSMQPGATPASHF